MSTTTVEPEPVIEFYQQAEENDSVSTGFLDILKKGKEIVRDKVSTIGNIQEIRNIQIKHMFDSVFLCECEQVLVV